MSRWIVTAGLSVAVVACWAGSVQAQLIDRAGSVERRARADAERDARLVRAQSPGLVPEAAQEPERFARIIPSAKSGDSSASFGATGMYVYDTTESADGLWYYTIRPSYSTLRSKKDLTHQRGLGLGADVQVNGNSSRIGVFTVSLDYLDVQDGFGFTAATGEWDYSLGNTGATLIGTLSAARLSPDGSSDSVSDVVPGVAFDYKTKTTTPVRLGVEYTFKNDVDEEDDYAFTMRVALNQTMFVKFGTGKHGKVLASFTQELHWPKP